MQRKVFWVVMGCGLVAMVGWTVVRQWVFCPVAEVDEKIVIANVRAGEEKTVQVPLRNLGRRKLVIKSIAGTCSCTRIRVNRQQIEPGEVAWLDVTVTGDDTKSDKFAWLVITTNEPSRPQLMSEVRIVPERLFSISPSVFDFGNVGYQTEVAEACIKLTGEGLGFLDILNKVSAVLPQLPGLALRQVRKADDITEFVVTLNKEVRGELCLDVILTSPGRKFEERVPLYAYVPSAVFNRVEPIVWDIAKEEQGKVIEIALPFRNEQESPVVVSAEILGDFGSVAKVEFCAAEARCVNLGICKRQQQNISTTHRWGHCLVRVQLIDGRVEHLVVSVRLG